jgi:predicted deacylase
VVDMRPKAVTARLRQVARMLAERGFVDKGVDMSRTAVTDRLKTMSALSTMCLRLQTAKITVRTADLAKRGLS